MGAPKQQDLSSNDYHTLRLLDLAILIANIYRGAQNPKVGFEDAKRTLTELVIELEGKKGVRIRRDVLESALWSCNLQEECGKFWHPQDREFKDFLKDILKRRQSFDTQYNFIKEKP